MMDDPAAASARYFDELAPRWDGLMPVGPVAHRVIEAAVGALGLRPGDTVLDAGCGTGVLFPFLLPLVKPRGKVIGLDVSPAMIDTARRKFHDPDLDLAAEDIGFFLRRRIDTVVAAIACFQAFPHFDNKKEIIDGFFRILRPAGRFAIFHVEGSAPLNAFHATLPPPVNAHVLPPAGDVAAQAREAGFTVRSQRDEPAGYLVLAEKPVKGSG